MNTADRFVTTPDIRAAIKGHETHLLDALGIRWREGNLHINCPYPDHPDNDPSWRWDQGKARAFCTCGSASILAILGKVEGINFEAAKIRAAELLNRPDLIHERRSKRRGRGEKASILPEQPRNGATPAEEPCHINDLTVARPRNGAPTFGATLASIAEAKKLPLAFLQSLGLRDVPYLGAPAIRIPYFAAERGTEPAIRYRVALTGRDKYRWRRGTKARLYGLDRLTDAQKAGSVTIVEGESDCWTLWHTGFSALGLPGATNWNEDRDPPLLDGIAAIYVLIEPDHGGKQMLAWLARSSRISNRVQLVRLNGFKDPSALYLDNPRRFRERWRAALDAAEPFTAAAEREKAARADVAEKQASDLIGERNILTRFAEDLEKAGLVGEDRNAKLIYLVLTTRLFERPVSAAIKGVSSGGKSYTVESILKFFPSTTYWARTAMSDRALAYSEENFSHRHLVIYEAGGIAGDMASYLLRSLLSEGRIRYELVEKTKDGMRPRLIEKEGPTGLVVTTTAARLHPENETRLLSLAIKDTQEQTAAVLLALARPDRGEGTIDYGPWHAFQDWLAAGECRVEVPFAEPLAKLIPPVAVRLRRDFGMLLGLIRAHALLHRAQRERDDRGRILATLDDYAAVRELSAATFAEGVEASVKPETREVVAVVEALNKGEVSVAEIAKALGLDKSAASRRVKVAITRGFLVNHEGAKGKPARIAIGDSMPGETDILPTPDRLAGRCGVAPLREPAVELQAPAQCLSSRLPSQNRKPLHGCTGAPGDSISPPPDDENVSACVEAPRDGGDGNYLFEWEDPR
jgi:MarR family